MKTADNEQQQDAAQHESAAKEPAQDIDDEDDAGDDEDISDMPSTSSGFAFSQPERCPTCQDLVVVNFKRHVRRCYECELCHRYFTFPSHKANCAKQLAEQEANRGKKDYSDCPICKKVVKFVATHIRLVHKQDPAIFSGRRSRGTQEQRAEASKVQKDYGRKVTKAFCLCKKRFRTMLLLTSRSLHCRELIGLCLFYIYVLCYLSITSNMLLNV